MKIKLILILAIVLIVIPIVLNACSSPGSSPTTQSDSQFPTDSIVESLLISLNKNNFSLWSKILDPNQKYPPKESFDQLCDDYKTLFGNYQSKDYVSSDNIDDTTGFFYVAHYSKAPSGVAVRGSIKTINGTTYIIGFAGLSAITGDVTILRKSADPIYQ
jgi:hypothetical protein